VTRVLSSLAILAKMGVRPVIYIVEGHALIGVDSGPTGYNTVWPLQTTMLGQGVGYFDAVEVGAQVLLDHAAACTVLDVIYLDEARASGLLSMP
jgi:hypothetical protein